MVMPTAQSQSQSQAQAQAPSAERIESLGPAERIIQALTQHIDHMVHNRPGIVTSDARHRVGVRWQQATWVKEGGDKVVYATEKSGRQVRKTRIGIGAPGTDEVRNGGRVVGRWQPPGLFPEVVAYLYRQIGEVWKMDNEFAARWASWAFNHESNRDLKVLLAAFMLVQSRFGEPVHDGDETFLDEDYRAVGEAMCLIRKRKDGFNPKLLLRVGDVLALPAVAEINRELGFGTTTRRAIVGRYNKVIDKWLRNIERNPKVLAGLIEKAGYGTAITRLARRVGYKPESSTFFQALRWRQSQASDGRRTVGIGEAVREADSWAELDESDICRKIIGEKPNWKVIVGKLPSSVGVTPAIMSAAVEAGVVSDQDLIILTPTLEELGLLEDATVGARWKAATERAENQRAAHVARNVRSQTAKDGLEEAVDSAAAKAVEEVSRGLRIYVFVDKSGSMQYALTQAKEYLAKFVGAFPLDKLHVCVFHTHGTEVEIQRPTQAGVTQAFRGHAAGGGTSYAAGVGCLVSKYRPAADEDALFIFVGDQLDNNYMHLADVIRSYGVLPAAFGLLHVQSAWNAQYPTTRIVEQTAAVLGIPCFPIDEKIFADPYAVPRTIRNLIASTPVGQAQPGQAAPRARSSLIEQILKTPLLQKPAWAC
jgi:hypothetical protein